MSRVMDRTAPTVTNKYYHDEQTQMIHFHIQGCSHDILPPLTFGIYHFFSGPVFEAANFHHVISGLFPIISEKYR